MNDTPQHVSEAFKSMFTAISQIDLATGSPVASSNGMGVGTGTTVLLTSAEMPKSKGHLRQFDVTTAPSTLMWDAGAVLEARNLGTDPRTIFTSDPGNNNALVPIISDDAPTILKLNQIGQVYDPGATITNKMVRFLLGKAVLLPDGVTLATRDWRLGDIVNSTPAISGPPPAFHNLTNIGHGGFEATYKTRHELIFVGASDLMLHAFDSVDGQEMFAYIPPNLIPKIAQLYAQWVADGYTGMGQPAKTLDHIYGVASSIRLADVLDDGGTPALPGDDQWRTVLAAGEGPGGHGVFALDVTHPYPGRTITINGSPYVYPPDLNFNPTQPFNVLWFKSDLDPGYTNLGETWSVPAMGITLDGMGNPKWELLLGSAYQRSPTPSVLQGKQIFYVDALTGAVDTETGTANNRAGGLVDNSCFFADTIGFSLTGNANDSLIAAGVHADLMGQIWLTPSKSPRPVPWATVGWDSLGAPEYAVDGTPLGTFVSTPEPIYYSPAIGHITILGRNWVIGAWVSGTYNEIDPQVNSFPNPFTPHLFIGLVDETNSCSQVMAIPITELVDSNGTPIQDTTRPVGSPMMLVSNNSIEVVYSLFDSKTSSANTCLGTSYIFTADLTNLDCLSVAGGQNAFGAMAGSSHFGQDQIVNFPITPPVVTPEGWMIGVSGDTAGVQKVGGAPPVTSASLSVISWNEIF